MEFETKYQRVSKELSQILEKRRTDKKMMALGYTSNLDLICDFDIDLLNRLLEQYMPSYTLEDMVPSEKINQIEDLLKTLVYYCKMGIGGEIDVVDDQVVIKCFQWVHGMGGTAVQAALALSAVECPSLVHLTDNSAAVCSILESVYISTVNKEGQLVHTDEAEHDSEQEVHFIIQFKKGDIIKWADQEVKVAKSNRLIITKVTVNGYLPLSKQYFTYLEENASTISSNVLSSFNCVVRKERMDEIIAYLEQHVAKFRKGNPDSVIFFEDAHFHSKDIRMTCSDGLYPLADIVSVNEEELGYTMHLLHQEIDTEDIDSCIKGAIYIRSKYHVRSGIIVHTKDYSMYVGNELRVGIDIEWGLMAGNLFATAKARNGTYGTLSQVAETLSNPLSKVGIEAVKTAALTDYGCQVVIVPTCYIDKPKYTIGLGDSFVAGVQTCF